MSSKTKQAGLLPELETTDGFVQLPASKRRGNRRCKDAASEDASCVSRRIIDGIKTGADLFARSLTTFAVLEVLGILLLLIVLQL